jgi:hypothetical protein
LTGFSPLLETGAGHSFAKDAFIDDCGFQLRQLPVRELTGLIDQEDADK